MGTVGRDDTEDLRRAERGLQAAQLAADADALDRLLDDRLIFTLGMDGKTYSKQDDLDIQRSGSQQLTRVDEEDLQVFVEGDTGVTWFLGTLAGEIGGEPFGARMRYTRTWLRDGSGDWRVIAAHASSVPE
ncbi:nuclear transport factor 2 family protein [Antrihabitans cavernicola]|uniref:Nuclear transport factor 2 family protein n=1 Tax=Antrihabitans cavernicola TaxID=2495913 RepID=A0A5A7S7N5_9NOCA|nr:nuclear transport factor 2 family protein [Spelaeibacter cavernicola]KAA0018913.1 nuclear transport factor 2 family protein [Spelaeibacter cavernicola]